MYLLVGMNILKKKMGASYKMECRGCGSNFRTTYMFSNIELPDGKDRICYKCGFNNGSKENEDKIMNAKIISERNLKNRKKLFDCKNTICAYHNEGKCSLSTLKGCTERRLSLRLE